MSGSARADFFISYTQADRAWAEWIGWQLEQAGYTVIVQAWDFLPGTDWVHQMHTAVQRAERTLAVLSPAYLETSEFGEAEWRAAFAADPSGEGRRLIPVRVLECHPEGLLKTRIYVDLAGLGERDAAAALLRGVGEHAGGRGASRCFLACGWRRPRIVRGSPARSRPCSPCRSHPVRGSPGGPGRWRRSAAGLTGPGSGHVVPVTGIGGVGKTQLVAEYAYAERSSYDVVWWVRAQPLAMALADLAALVADPRLPDPPQLSAQATAEDRLAAARDWLERHDRCLLIVDNVDDPAAVRPLLPRAGGGHVLLTARSDVDWSGWAAPLPLDMLDPGDASGFLRERSGDLDEAAAAALAAELGRLPLALEQAAGYIAETGGLTLAGYLALFRTRGRELLGRGRPADRDDTVSTTWSLSLDRLTQASPSAVDLLTVAAFLAADDIPVPLLTEQAGELPGRLAGTVGDPLVLADAIGVLRRYGLAKAVADAITVHRLLQAVVRDGLDEDAQRRWAGSALAAVTAGFPGDRDDPLAWPRCQRLVSHALAAAGHAERLAVDLDAVSLLLDRVGVYLERRGQYGSAVELLRRALVLDERLGADDATLSVSHGHLGLVLIGLGDLPAARAELTRAIELGERVLGPDHPDLMAPHSNLGEVLRQMGDLPAARAELTRAIELGERVLGPDHPDLMAPHSNLGIVLRQLGDLPAARAELTRAIELAERVLGPDHPNLVLPHSNLGIVLLGLGDPPAARAELTRAIELGERVLGPDHPDLMAPHSNLGEVLRQMGDLPAARAELTRAIELAERVLGPDHPDLVLPHSNLGGVLYELGDPPAARAELTRAIELAERVLGPDHPNLVLPHSNLGIVLLGLGDLPAARAELTRAIELGERVLGPDHPDLMAPHSNLGEVLRQMGDLPAARAELTRAIELAERVLGPDHPDLVLPHSNLGIVLYELGDLPAARAELTRAIELAERVLGPDHPADFAVLLYRLGTLEEDIGDLDSAQARLIRAVSVDEQVYGPDHNEVSADLEALARIQERLGDLPGATASLRRALEIRQQNDGTDSPQAAELRDRLHELGART